MNNLIEKAESSKKVIELLKKIKKIEVKKDLFETVEDQIEEVSIEEKKILLESAHFLASSTNVENQKKALNIATTLPLISHSNGINLASLLVLRKLGNYPAISLLERRKDISDYKRLLGGLTSVEAYVVESLNIRKFFDREYLLTNFQKKVVDLVNFGDGISISAPTSAGKSFIFLKILLDMINNQLGATVIYIVPTRALIKQVMNDLLGYIKELELKNIYVGCSSEIEPLVNKPDRSNILVLTQERLYQLCADVNYSKKLNTRLVIIDEAHNIQSEGRGVLLENAIKFAQNLWPRAKVLFSSPLVKNPEKLLETFKIGEGIGEKESFPLVRQNLIKVIVSKDKLLIKTIYEEDNDEILVGEVQYKNSGREAGYRLLADVTTSLWNNQTSIVYANEPMQSTDVIRTLMNSGKFQPLNDERLNEFADFIEEFIAENYELAAFIKCGLAFHFGSLPAIIRSGIEDLFRAGALKIVCCTSTLLEGMNMPAKNIFVYKPEKGRGEPIDKLNFWNLAGRAGRMGNDFSGNIICIEIDKWKTNPTNGERLQEITPSSEKRLKLDSGKFKEYLLNRNTARQVDDYDEQLTSLIINERVQGRTLVGSIYEDENNVQILKEIDQISETMIDEFLPPKELLQKIPGIMPERINDLWRFFESVQLDISEYIPLYPVYNYGTSYQRFINILVLINKFFEGDSWNERFIRKISFTGYRWMLGTSLSQIIFYNKSFLEKDQRKITSHLKSQVDFLNNTIRYKIVKYTQVYNDVLKMFLGSIGKNDEVDKVVNLSSYLEYGACSIPALEFMAIGLPREAAIILSSKIGYQEIYTNDYCIDWLKKFRIDTLDISSYLKKQIQLVQLSL
ncbi:DEAD/DEAH box helicase [Paenibacillus sp. UNC451MF]|uniref:DEAD/DEAH box helicase n=1 Tax=Paenibacillus sp. UNC451MF TaxID=1449063 RepID=UPI000491CC16|nr:DEAD/DEAH box helicase [Paenibacillus sp. UNC451MF]